MTIKPKNVVKDYEFLFGAIPSMRNLISASLFFPGFRAVTLYRLQRFFEARNRFRAAQSISNLNQFLTGTEICVGAKIGVPLIIRHPAGIVVGGGAVVGDYCVILQNVTIGEKFLTNANGKYPTIGDSVQIGCNSSIIGEVQVGSHAVIGAHTLVLNSVSESETVTGLH